MQYLASHVASVDLASLPQLLQLVSLIALPFAHEDLAIVLGGYIVVNGLMPVGLVVLSIYGGIVVSDFALYGIGAGARRLPWLQRRAVDDRVLGFRDALKRNLFALVALCRLVPGLASVAGVACGWARVSLARFTIASLIVSALYLPLVLYLVVVFGDALDDHMGIWAWPFLLAVLGAAAFARRRILAFRDAAASEEPIGPPPPAGDGLAVPPPLAGLRRVAPTERIPAFVFRVPLVLHWIVLGLRHRGLTLPSIVNPGLAGFGGESTADCLRALDGPSRALIADFVVMRRRADPATLDFDHARALRLMADAALRFPLVAKPDIGRHGLGVRLIADAAALKAYLARFPAGARLILQRYVARAGEATVRFARMPDEEARVVSLTLRYFPHVIGDGTATLRELVGRDPRLRRRAGLHLGLDPSHLGCDRAALDRVPARGEPVRLALIASRRAGALWRDASDAITPALAAKVATVAAGIPDCHYGRIDLRFQSMDAFLRGEDLVILAINGAGGDADDAFDPALPLRETYRRLFAHQRLRFAIGARNRARGFAPAPIGEWLGRLVQRADLVCRYPASS